MLAKVLYYVVIISVCVSVCVGDYVTDEDYVDVVIDMLLNGESREFEMSSEVDNGEEPVLAGGIWKCGQCEDLEQSNLVYSEVNDVDNEMLTDESVDIQIGLSLPNMKCVTVSSNMAGVVRRVAGACRGDTVTLSVAPAQHFTVQVYN